MQNQRTTTIDPKFLFQLSEVIEQGSLSRAAVALGLTQPTLSRNIKLIEEHAGGPVLRRGRYGVTPTNLGEQLAEHGRAIHDSMQLATDTIKQWQSGIASQVRLGAGGMIAASMLPEYLSKNFDLRGRYSLHITTDSAPNLMQMLRNKKIDIALMPAKSYPAQETLSLEHLYTNSKCVVAGAKSPLCEIEGKVDVALLAEQPWISINHLSRVRHTQDDTLSKLQIEQVVPKLSFTGDITTPWRLLRDSSMLSILPCKLAELIASTGGIKILDLSVELPKRSIAMWMLNTVEHETSVLEVANCLKTYFREIENEQVAAKHFAEQSPERHEAQPDARPDAQTTTQQEPPVVEYDH